MAIFVKVHKNTEKNIIFSSNYTKKYLTNKNYTVIIRLSYRKVTVFTIIFLIVEKKR